MKKIYFATTNPFKAEEIRELFLNVTNIEFNVSSTPIHELMDFELENIVKDKILKAYSALGIPCAVEHGALHIDYLKGLPGGISKIVWDKLGGKICELLPDDISERTAIARSVVGYCDGRNIHLFKGETKGLISKSERGTRQFQWDPIFIPEGHTKTFAELELKEKFAYSQAIKAWNNLIKYLSD